MLIMISGDMGSGKTLLMAHFARKYQNTPVYSNFNLKLPNYTPLDVYMLSTIRSGIILIDEAYTWLESRASGSDLNLYVGRIGFISRKRKVDLICSAQLGSTLDLRFRELAKIRIVALGMARDLSGFLYVVNERSILQLPISTAKELYKIYDTEEEEDTLRPSMYDINRINPLLDKITDQITKKCGKKVKITRGIVKDLFLINKWDISLMDLAYNRIKRKQLGIE